MSIKIMTRIWENEDEWLRGSRRLVLLALADNANDQGYCWPAIDTIAKKSNLGRRYTMMLLSELEEREYITRQQREGTSTMYLMGGVKPASLGGEARLTPGVNPASPEPSINHQLITKEKEEERPTIFSLYENNIGSITPVMADLLKQAEQDYAPEWIEEAIKIAVASNARKWAYIASILKDWDTNGYKNDKRKKSSTSKPSLIEGYTYAGTKSDSDTA